MGRLSYSAGYVSACTVETARRQQATDTASSAFIVSSSDLQHRPIHSLYRAAGVACKGSRKGERWAVISGFLWQSERCCNSCDAVNMLTTRADQKESKTKRSTSKSLQITALYCGDSARSVHVYLCNRRRWQDITDIRRTIFVLNTSNRAALFELITLQNVIQSLYSIVCMYVLWYSTPTHAPHTPHTPHRPHTPHTPQTAWRFLQKKVLV